jgi:hypothetical protein
MPDAGVFLDAQRAAAENAARMASTACHYTMSVNRAWLNFWTKHLTQYSEMPKRFADAQTDFVERAFSHYQESVQQLSGIAEQIEEEAKEVMRETQAAGEQAAQQFRAEASDMQKASRPKEMRPPRAAEEQRESKPQPSAH